jgi:tetratricopeptide (TPR) repeat protein
LEEQLGDYERAAKLYEWAQRRQPDNPLWRTLRAQALMKSGQFDRAGRILRFALKRFPDDHRLNALMGIWHAKRVEWVEAEQFFETGRRRRDAGRGIKNFTHPLTCPLTLLAFWLKFGFVKARRRKLCGCAMNCCDSTLHLSC